jgi:hypothetical protein
MMKLLPLLRVSLPFSKVSFVNTTFLYALMNTPTKIRIPNTMDPYSKMGAETSATVVAK